MTIPIIPESAPFTVEQRAWLNGFFAGMLGISGSDGGTLQAPQALASVAKANGNGHALSSTAEENFPWHDPALPLSDRVQLAEGKPIERRLMAAMAQLDCGACGYLCKTYSEAIARGEEKDLMKCTPGGMDTAKLLKRLVAEQKSSGQHAIPSNGSSHPAANGAAANANGHSNGSAAARTETSNTPQRSALFSARLLRSVRLTHDESPKDTRHVEIDLGDSNIAYEPGDALGIIPLNCDTLVDQVVRALGATGGEWVRTNDRSAWRLREILKTKFALTRTSSSLLELMSKHAQVEEEAAALKKAIESDDDSVASLDVAELLERFPSARPPLDEFLETLGPLQPRLYSISSSLRTHPRQVHLTVGIVRFENLGRWKYGVASHFLGVRSQPGDELCVFVQSSPRFRLPADPRTPVIMVGPGTGIAPFRAFLQEREAIGAQGKNWLFFGNQYMGYDYLYRDQLEGWLDTGLLTRLDLAFSRDKAEKLYVQHRMVEHGAELWRWLQDGAYFYVCGDAKRMAPDVDRALNSVAITYGGLTQEQAKSYINELAKSHRYHRDVY